MAWQSNPAKLPRRREASYGMDNIRICLNKDGVKCAMGYARSSYDFDDGSMVFLSPGQVASAENVELASDAIGWTIAFHPDLKRFQETIT